MSHPDISIEHATGEVDPSVEEPKAFLSSREIIEHFHARLMDIIMALPQDGMYGTEAVGSAVRREVLDIVNAAYAQGYENASIDLQISGVMYDQCQKISD